jgi:hypothetical protein
VAGAGHLGQPVLREGSDDAGALDAELT